MSRKALKRKLRSVRVYMDEEFYNKLQELCDSLQIDISSFLRLRAAEYLRQQSVQQDLAEFIKRRFDEFVTKGGLA